jgi:hypothetical protein
MNKKMQTSQIQVIRQEESVRQLQAKLNSMKGQVIDLKVFSGPVTGNTYEDRSSSNKE